MEERDRIQSKWYFYEAIMTKWNTVPSSSSSSISNSSSSKSMSTSTESISSLDSSHSSQSISSPTSPTSIATTPSPSSSPSLPPSSPPKPVDTYFEDKIVNPIDRRQFRHRLYLFAAVIFFIAVIARDIYIDAVVSPLGDSIIRRKLASTGINFEPFYKIWGAAFNLNDKFNDGNNVHKFDSSQNVLNSISSTGAGGGGGRKKLNSNDEFMMLGYQGIKNRNSTAALSLDSNGNDDGTVDTDSNNSNNNNDNSNDNDNNDDNDGGRIASILKKWGHGRVWDDENNNNNKEDNSYQNLGNHFLALDGLSPDLCKTDFKLGQYYYQGHIIDENNMFFLPVELMGVGTHKHFGVCYSNHTHQHMFRIQSLHAKDAIGDCDIFVSVGKDTYPTPTNWDWRSNTNGDDTVNVYSFSREFQNLPSEKRNLVIGVYGKEEWNKCSIGIEIVTLPKDEMLYKLGLRGGHLMLPNN